MLFDWNTIAFPASVQDLQLSAPLTLSGEGLWVCLVSSGQCSASVPAAGPLPLGAALILPPQSVPAGHLILSRAPLALVPESICHLLCVQLTGQAASQFLAGLHELPFLAKGGSCPAAAELMDRLAEEKAAHSRARSQLAYALLCELADADSAASALPPLVQAAIEDIRANYAGLYGVEELSERETVVKKVTIVPLEVIIRNISAGSFAKRFGVEEGIVFDAPTIEFSYKNDDLGDPLMNSYHALALKLATQEEIDLIKKYAFAVNDLLRGFMKEIGIDLVDFKLEFGKTSDGTIVLADEISPDTCRLWDEQTHEKLDKDRFRRDMGGAEEAYEEVMRRLMGDQ